MCVCVWPFSSATAGYQRHAEGVCFFRFRQRFRWFSSGEEREARAVFSWEISNLESAVCFAFSSSAIFQVQQQKAVRNESDHALRIPKVSPFQDRFVFFRNRSHCGLKWAGEGSGAEAPVLPSCATHPPLPVSGSVFGSCAATP